ncbi:MAG: BLUF domain-containing protein [Acidimicrobiales bacterium]
MTGPAQQLIHCAYTSLLAPECTEAELVPILTKARRTNTTLQATGILLFHQRSFFQVLEGPRQRIEALYERISGDPRHTRVTQLVNEPISERSFRDWTMGLMEPTPDDLAAVPGLAPLVAAGGCLADLNAGQARALLDSLARGPLRLRCETAMVRSLITSLPER